MAVLSAAHVHRRVQLDPRHVGEPVPERAVNEGAEGRNSCPGGCGEVAGGLTELVEIVALLAKVQGEELALQAISISLLEEPLEFHAVERALVQLALACGNR